MDTEVDRARPLADGSRRRFVGTLGLATLGIATLGIGGLCRVLKNLIAVDDSSSGFDRRACLDEIDEGGGRTLYEIIYCDRRLGSYWPVGFYPELSGVVAAVTIADQA